MDNFIDIEREIEKRYIIGFRRIFEFDDEFLYNEDDLSSKIIITPDYPENQTPFKVPHIVVTQIAYEENAQFTLNNNFFSDIQNNGVVNWGRKSVSQIPYSLTAVCLGKNDVSRNLANKLFYYIAYKAYTYLSDNLQLNIQFYQKGASTPKEQYPETFQTPISIRGHLGIQIDKTPFNYLIDNVSVPVDRKEHKIESIDQDTTM